MRIGAAFVVVVSHAWPVLCPRHPLPWPGRVRWCFFVLSSMVFAHAAQRPGLALSGYTCTAHRGLDQWLFRALG